MAILDEDEINEAIQFLLDKPKDADGRMGGSCSYLQRMLQCGYNHAAAIIEHLESTGFLSECDNLGKRRLLRAAR